MANDGMWFRGDKGLWAIPDTEEVAQAIQDGLDKKIPMPDPLRFMTSWTWESSVLKLMKILKERDIFKEWK
jgi:hypothetical protein